MRAVTTSVDSYHLPPPCSCFTVHALLVWALGWWMPPLISYVLPQCVRGWCVVWGACVDRHRPSVPQPPSAHVRGPRPSCASACGSPGSPAPSGADCRGCHSFSLATDTARCTLSLPSPTPPAPPPRPLVGVCLVPCVTCACGATTSGTACYRMAAGGAWGGDASGALHVSFMMVPAAPRRIDARGSDRL